MYPRFRKQNPCTNKRHGMQHTAYIESYCERFYSCSRPPIIVLAKEYARALTPRFVGDLYT